MFFYNAIGESNRYVIISKIFNHFCFQTTSHESLLANNTMPIIIGVIYS